MGSKTSAEGRHTQKSFVWMSSTLLLVQLLTISLIIQIVTASDSQNHASGENVAIIDKLDQLAFSIGELENGLPVNSGKDADQAWKRAYGIYRTRFDEAAHSRFRSPEVLEILQQADAIVNRMAVTRSQMSGAAGPAEVERLREFRTDLRTALYEVQNAQRVMRLRLSLVSADLSEKTGYLKFLLACACVLAFGISFVFRQYRIDRAAWRQFEQELRRANEELASALSAAQEGSEAKNQFLANVSHEMRTPLNGIIGMSTVLLETDLTGEQRDYAETSLRSAESLVGIINDVLDFAKMRSRQNGPGPGGVRPAGRGGRRRQSVQPGAGRQGADAEAHSRRRSSRNACWATPGDCARS